VGRKTVRYRKMGDADDYAHAEVYDLIASELWLHRMLVGKLNEESLTTADDHVEFERSRLADYDPADDYYAGGREE
jgi:hypothetical protein